MNEKARRKELRAQYQHTRPEAGVYLIVNQQNHRYLLGSTPDLASIRSKMEFARSTNTPGVLDLRLSKDIRQFGMDAFSLEVLEVFEPQPDTTPVELQRDLAALEELWRERLEPLLHY